jgi:hypothetical protein
MQRVVLVMALTVLCAGCDSKVVTDIEASPAAVVATVAAILAFLSGVLGPFVQWRVGRKTAAASQTSADASMLAARTAGALEIAKLRMVWMEPLRNKLSEYHSILMNLENDDRIPDVETRTQEDRKLSELGTHLDLLLNQNDPLQKALWDISDQIYKTPGQPEREALDEPLIRAGRAVLEAEWKKVEIEMAGGEFQTGR